MERSRSNNPPTRLRSGIATLVVAMSFAIGTGTVHAAGTAAGTPINNLSTLNYSVSGVPQPAIGSSPTGNTVGAGTATTFVVDNSVNVTVVTTDIAPGRTVVPGSTLQVTTFTVTNTGNTVQDFLLASAQLATSTSLFGDTDNFDATACVQFAETNGTAGYQDGADTATFIDELAADASRAVYVVCSIPGTQINGDHAVVSLTATARAGGSAGGAVGAALTQTGGADTPGTVDIVFADGAGSDDGVRDAAFSVRSAYQVVTSTLTVTKTSSVICDPLNGVTNPKRIPGAIVRYTITITNSSATAANLATVTDALAGVVTFDGNLVTGTGTCTSAGGTPTSGAGLGFSLDVTGDIRPGTYPKFFTTANDADGADNNSGAITINYATAMPVEGVYLTPGLLRQNESVVVYFNVTVN